MQLTFIFDKNNLCCSILFLRFDMFMFSKLIYKKANLNQVLEDVNKKFV